MGISEMTPMTHCRRGHPFNAENTLLRNVGGKTYRACRECIRLSRVKGSQEEYKRRYSGRFGAITGPNRITCKRGHDLSGENRGTQRRSGSNTTFVICLACERERPTQLDLAKIKENVIKLVKLLQEGGTITGAERQGVMSYRDWKAVQAQQPKLANRLLKLSRVNARKAWAVNASIARNSIIRAPLVRRWSDMEIVEAATIAVPRNIPLDDRQEIISQMVLACLEGRLTPKQMAKRWVEFRKENTKFYNPRFNPLAHDRQRHMPVLSLEGTMLFANDSEGVALGTTLSNGFWNQSLNPEELLIMKENEL